MSPSALPIPHRWSRAEYDRMVEGGVFHPEARLELIDGEILEMSPQSSRHATGVRLVEDALRRMFRPGYDVRAQMPLALGEASEPEPDLAVVRGSARDYAAAHPTTALLVVEVAESSLAFDRGAKHRLYARAGIAEYWVLNLEKRRLEVYRAPRGDAYATVQHLAPGEAVAPLARPGEELAVADLLP